MATLTTDKSGTIVVAALRARANFGKLLRRVEDERGRSLSKTRDAQRVQQIVINQATVQPSPEM